MNKKILAIAFFAVALIGSKAFALTYYNNSKGAVILTQANTTHDVQPIGFSIFLKNDPTKYFFVASRIIPGFEQALLPRIFLNDNYKVTQSGGYNYKPSAIGDTNNPGSGWSLFLDEPTIVLSQPPNKITIGVRITKNTNCTELQCKFTCFVPNDRNSSILGDKGIFRYVPGFNNNIFTLTDTFSNLTAGKTYSCYASCVCGDMGLEWQHGPISSINIGAPVPPPPPQYPFYYCDLNIYDCPTIGMFESAVQCQQKTGKVCYDQSQLTSCKLTCQKPPKPTFYSCNLAIQDCPPAGQFDNEVACKNATGKDCYSLNNIQQCKDLCKVAPCGNGKIDPGEQCDPNETETDFKNRTGKDSLAWADMKLRCDKNCQMTDLKNCDIAVFGGEWEEMEKVLTELNIKFDWYPMSVNIASVNLSKYDSVILDCYAEDRGGPVSAINNYVSNGGKLYISDFNLPILNNFPEVQLMDFGNDQFIEPNFYKISIVDPEMRTFMGTSSANLMFDTVAMYLYPQNAKTLLYAPEIDKTIAVHFNHGQGSVIYSSFHMTAQDDDMAKKITYYYLYKVLATCKK